MSEVVRHTHPLTAIKRRGHSMERGDGEERAMRFMCLSLYFLALSSALLRL